jgi:hypothetical protein
MIRERFEQLHRFFSLRCSTLHPYQATVDPWWWKLEPIATWVRTACQSMIIPSSWFTVDEAMVPFVERSNHIVKMDNKPVSEGFKIWALEYDGYVED